MRGTCRDLKLLSELSSCTIGEEKRYKGNLSPARPLEQLPSVSTATSPLLVYRELSASALSKFVRVLLMFTVLPQCSPWLIQLSSYTLLAFQGFCDLSPLFIQQWHIICKWQCHVFCVSLLYTMEPTDVFKPHYTTYICKRTLQSFFVLIQKFLVFEL